MAAHLSNNPSTATLKNELLSILGINIEYIHSMNDMKRERVALAHKLLKNTVGCVKHEFSFQEYEPN